jgi:hydroxyacylglutathione hydrolase
MITAVELNERLKRGYEGLVLDVRSRDEWNNGHIKDSLSIYVGSLEKRVDELPKGKQITVVCESGTRSSFAASILLKADRKNVINMLGGMSAWRRMGYPVEVAK